MPRGGRHRAASALVERYLAEIGLDEVAALVDTAFVVGTSVISRAEVAAALFWQDMLGERVTVATFTPHLWKAAHATELGAWPDELA